MARQAGKLAEIYVNEYNLTGRTSMIELAVDNQLIDVTCFGDTGLEFVEGLYGFKLTQNSFLDPADDNIDENLWDEINASSAALVGYAPAGTGTQGNVVYEMSAWVDEQPRPLNVAGAALLNCTWQGTTSLVRGTLLVNEAVTGTGVVSGSNQNVGATSSGTTFVAVFRCLSVTGTGSLNINVEESSDDGSTDPYALISGISQTFTGVGAARKATTSATEAWKRINVNAFTGFTSATIMVVVGTLQGT